jgi:hypothetical protein
MPLTARVWRTTVNWLDANRIGMTFSFFSGQQRSFSLPQCADVAPTRSI